MPYSGYKTSYQTSSRIINAPTVASPRMPPTPMTEVQRAMLLHRKGNLAAAEKLYTSILLHQPAQFECLHYLGLLKAQQGQTREALELMQRAIAVNRSDPSAHSNLGLVQHTLGMHDAALGSYGCALALDPRFVIALGNRGNILRALGRPAEALKDYEAALASSPNSLELRAACALTLKDMGRFAEALQHYDRLIALHPTADFYNARGCMQKLLFLLDDALASFEQAIRMDPDHVDAWINKAGTHFMRGEQQAADDAFDQCIRLAPGSATARLKRMAMRIPAVREHDDDTAEIRENFAADVAEFRQWIIQQTDINPLEVVGAMQPFYLAYQEKSNVALLASYGQVCYELMMRWSAQHGIAPRAARRTSPSKLRIGVASAHFNDHPVWTAIVKGWFVELDRTRFELHAFDLGTRADEETRIARAGATVYHEGPRSVPEWAERIVSSGLDVLIYPELGMDQTTMQLAAMRLAHRQLASWGHPDTTGLPTIDAYLSAEGFEDSKAQQHYSERLITLPNLGCHYLPPDVADIDVNLATLGISSGAPLFICAGSPFKYGPENDHVFVDIARRVEDAQFLFFTNPRLPALSARYQQRIATAFRDAGFDPSRHLVIAPWQPPAAFYSIMRQAHVYLDTIGFSGFNTAMQAVDCALPIVTIEGKFMRGRFASAILKRMGFDELVHAGKDAYVASAVRLATEAGHRRALQAAMRRRRDVLYRDATSIRALEKALVEMCNEDR